MRKRGSRRQSHGVAWHWRQTDNWYYTLPGTKRRVPLLDENGKRIRGKENKQTAELALARIKLSGDWQPAPVAVDSGDWLVARVCSEFIQHCQRRVDAGALNPDYSADVGRYLNRFCKYCGALAVGELQKSHVRYWLESQKGWRSLATHRNVLAILQAAFNHAHEMFDLPNPLKGLKKPPPQPRLHSFTDEEEQALYEAADEAFGSFLFAAIHTGLRPFCELAKLTADEVILTGRGMMWRVYSSKTKKTRKIPVKREVAARVRKLIKTAPCGSGIPLFRNCNGAAWKKGHGGKSFRSLRKKLGWQKDPRRGRYSCYTCRHTFAHRMLSGHWNGGVGCSIETLAELMGDTPKVAFDHYGKEWGQHYQDPLWAAIGVVNRQPPKRKRA